MKDTGNCSRRCFLKTSSAFALGLGAAAAVPSFTRASASAPAGLGLNPAPRNFEPAYLALHRNGELAQRAEKVWNLLSNCSLCPRRCGAPRLDGKRGFCRAPGDDLVISSFQAHFGEERPLVGRNGSGTIFLTHCNLRCVFCQNWQISHMGRGSGQSIADMSNMMLRLQERGCHNINLVTPTHYLAHILKALDLAVDKGLRIPLVYNTSGFERTEIIKMLDGIVDIYLPDFKFWDAEMAKRYMAGAENYPALARGAISEMNRQVGVAKAGDDGLIHRGLMIRHLVMPNDAAGSEQLIDWIAETLPKETYVNIMAQYSPAYQALDHAAIARRVTVDEYRNVVKHAQASGLTNLDVRGQRWLR